MKKTILLLSFATCVAVVGFTSCKSDKKDDAANTAANNGAAPSTPTAGMSTPAGQAGQPTSTTTNVGGTNVTVNSTTPTSVPGSPQGQEAAKPTGPVTTVAYEETSYNYGKVVDGDVVKHVYKFKNTGKEPLIISDAKGSCGCTVPQWPKDPIAPGATGEIKVEFNSKGKQGPQEKKVTVTANTNPAQSILTIKGEVAAKPK